MDHPCRSIQDEIAAKCINEWLSQQEDLAPGSTAERGVGFGSFELRGSTINALAQPYRFYLLQRVQDEFEALNSDEQTDVTSMLTDAGMQQMLTTKLDRRIGRQNNLEVWLYRAYTPDSDPPYGLEPCLGPLHVLVLTGPGNRVTGRQVSRMHIFEFS